MILKIFLDDKSFHRLKQSIPAASPSKLIIKRAFHLKFFGGNTVVSCEEAEARNLLLYADHCPGVIASIHKALRSAGLPLDPAVTPADAYSRAPSLPSGSQRAYKSRS
jgi:hypothetical protein